MSLVEVMYLSSEGLDEARRQEKWRQYWRSQNHWPGFVSFVRGLVS